MSGDGDQRPGLRDRLSQLPHVDDAPLQDSGWADNRAPLMAPGTQRPADPFERPSEAEPFYEPVVEPGYEPIADEGEEWVERRRRRRWPWVLLLLFLVITAPFAYFAWRAWQTFDSIERVPVSEALSTTVPGHNILIVGTDSREGIDGSVENAEAIIGEPVTGQRSDTIMIFRVGDDGTRLLLSIPRDLWLPIDGGDPQRINTAIRNGPEGLINTIQDELGIPISNYVEVDLAGFIGVVDAVGGVTIEIPYPAFDSASGLDLPVAGEVTLDSVQSLAYVRSRRYTEIVDGVEVRDPTSDLGRVKRQQIFLKALIAKVSEERNPLDATDAFDAASEAVRIDDRTSLTELLDLALEIRDGLPESTELPTVPADIGGRSVLLLGPGAEDVLAQFGGSG